MGTVDLVETWAGIAKVLGKSVATVRNWAALDDALGQIIKRDGSGRVFASRKALIAYAKKRNAPKPYAAGRGR